ncbi:MAG: hypothetical protein HC915_08395 [Anaerolineae bacterium]|nr:hypothetical protein [Anaerolineae bacterium]
MIIQGAAGTSFGNLNPVLCNDSGCTDVVTFMFPSLIGVDPPSSSIQPNVDGALASDWTISEDGLTYTFNFREGEYTWNDGTPISLVDVAFSFEAYLSGENDSPVTDLYQFFISDVAVDEATQTVSITFNEATCENLRYAGVQIVPAHYWGVASVDEVEPFDYSVMDTDDFATNPAISAGAFQFRELVEGERIVLEANQNAPGAEAVIPEGYLYTLIPDQTVIVERFLAGELNVIDTPQVAERDRIRESADHQFFEFAGNSWDYLALNFADPENPRSAVYDTETNTVTGYTDIDGNEYDSEVPHPLFADTRVRRAIQHGIDLDAIMERAVFGEGEVMASSVNPVAWSKSPDIQPIPYDPEMAMQLLNEAGWTMNDSGVLVNEAGEPFEFELLTNAGNTRREQIGELVQDQLGQLGITVDFVAIDFNQLLEVIDSQEWDAFILGWLAAFPFNPDQTQLFSASQDVVGTGNNAQSYYNPEFERLTREALTVPGCDIEERAAIYHQLEQILQDDQAYIWLFVQGGFYASSADIDWGEGPFPNQLWWNVDEWTTSAN